MFSALLMFAVAVGCDTPFDASLNSPITSPPVGSSVVASITVTIASPSLTVGQTTKASAVAKDGAENVVSSAPITWESMSPQVATVSSAGDLTAVAAGTAMIRATSEGKSGTATLTVAPKVSSGSTGGTLRIPLVIKRFVSGAGQVLVSNAIPLTVGALFPSDLDKVQVFVEGVEQSIYVERLEGEHSDGSLRSVFVQFYSPVTTATTLSGELVIGASRGTTDIPKPNNGRSLPAAVALPTDPDYLVSTDIVGPTITAAASSAFGSPWNQYEQDFGKYADLLWTSQGEDGCDDYYDRALAYYAAWARTGNLEYWRRGTRCAVTYRVGYLEANNYGSSPHWSQLEGLDLHYTLTGDDSSRYAIGRVEKVLSFWYPYFDRIPETTSMDNRIRARTLISMLLSWRLNIDGERAKYAAQLDTAITRIAASQLADGSYRFPLLCDEELNYMEGQLNDALIKTYLYYRQIPAIKTAVQRSADFLWNTQWLPSVHVFQYATGYCEGKLNTNPGLDLNGLLVNTFAFTYASTGDIKYRQEADQVFAGAVEHSSLTGSKQFNQQYTSSFLYLGLRR